MKSYWTILTLLPCIAAAEPRGEYQPMAFLAGHCWKGQFPGDEKVTDEHCFTWVYGGQFLRDRHTVRARGKPDAEGESIYFWNSKAQQLEYLYIESDGGVSRGPVSVETADLVFPDTEFVQDGKAQVYRSRWRPEGTIAYQVLTEFKVKDGWVPGFKVTYRLVSS